MKSLFTKNDCGICATMTIPRLIPIVGTKETKESAKWVRSITRDARRILHAVMAFRAVATTLEAFEFNIRKDGWELTASDKRTLRLSQFVDPRFQMVIELKEV
jgi:hypothetical protein